MLLLAFERQWISHAVTGNCLKDFKLAAKTIYGIRVPLDQITIHLTESGQALNEDTVIPSLVDRFLLKVKCGK